MGAGSTGSTTVQRQQTSNPFGGNIQYGNMPDTYDSAELNSTNAGGFKGLPVSAVPPAPQPQTFTVQEKFNPLTGRTPLNTHPYTPFQPTGTPYMGLGALQNIGNPFGGYTPYGMASPYMGNQYGGMMASPYMGNPYGMYGGYSNPYSTRTMYGNPYLGIW